MIDISQYLTQWFGVQVTALIGLIAVDVLLGVALAIKQGLFDWKKLSDFYLKMIIPYLIGWVAFSILTKFVAPVVLPAQSANLISDGLAGVAWGAIVVTMARRIYENGRAIYGELFPKEISK